MRMGPRHGFGAAIVGLLLTATIAIAEDSIIVGTDGPDTLNGTATADSIYGRAGDDKITGGGGDDELDGGTGSDTLSGGDGTDAVLYSGSTAVEASLDGQQNDGAPGEKDLILPDVEDLYGGDGGDKLTGNDGPNTIDGGAGDDRVSGGAGSDALFGGEGDDVIDARDGFADRVECGPGNDTATVDILDTVVECEQVARPGLTQTPLAAVRGKTIQLLSVANGSRVRIVCVSGCGQSGATLAEASNVKKNKLGRVVVPLGGALKKIKTSVIEIGVTAPESTTACVQYKVNSAPRLTKVKGAVCGTSAKSF